MEHFKQTFNNGLNADDDFEYIGEGQYVNGLNVRFGTTDTGAVDRIESIGGTIEKLNNYLSPGINTGNGGCSDDETNRIVYFVHNSNGDHAIFCYDKATDTIYKVLLNSQVTGGLNFSLNNYIHSAKYIDGKVYWVEGSNNEPRKLNVESGIKLNHPGFTTTQPAYISPLPKWSITQIKRPPLFPITWTKAVDSAYINNLILLKSYQFTYQYIYKDNEVSALSTFSALVPCNYKAELNNSIIVTIPLTETIDDDVYKISICVKYGNIGGVSRIKSYDKDKDLAAITAHNAGTALSFTFYDDIAFDFLDAVSAVNSFDIMPLSSETQEYARDRLFLGNNKFGYTTPNTTSLALTAGTFNTGNAGSYVSDWRSVVIQFQQELYPFNIIPVTYYYAYSSALPGAYYYLAYTNNSMPPATLNASDATTAWATEFQIAAYFARNYAPMASHAIYTGWVYASSGNTTTIVIAATNMGVQFFKSASSYSASIAFFDKYRRKCGVVNIPNKINIPDRTYNQTVFSSIINWTLSSTPSLSEIPDWAYYYQIHVTKNLTTRFFLDGMCEGAAYATKDPVTQLLSYGTTYNAITTYALALSITSLNALGIGYVFADGDLAKVHKSTVTNFNAKVIGTDGVYVLLAPFDIGTVSLTGTNFLFELYTPYKQSGNEPFYETGPIYSVVNPGTVSRVYGVTIGSIAGDCYSIQRTTSGMALYTVEAMSPNDIVWKIWNQDRGWINIVDTIGQTVRKNNIVFSDVYLPGTKINGLNKIQPLNTQDLDGDNGPLRKLQLANKVQIDGTVLLGICENETASCYLGEQEIFDAQGSAYIAHSANVIGTIKALAGSKGTKNPESVFNFNGLVEWYDSRNGCFVQYSNNGLFPISNNKLKRVSKLITNSLATNQLIIAGCDPHHKEFLFSIPYTETPPKGNLEDYSGLTYPYDIYDGQPKTLVYKYEVDKWLSPYGFTTEAFINLGSNLFSIKGGVLYIHNTGSSTIYGNTFLSIISFVANPEPGEIKTFASIALEVNVAADFVHLRTEDPYTQSSDLVLENFTAKEGIYKAPLFRNRLDPNAVGVYLDKQFTGEKLFGKYLLVMLQFTKKVALKVSNIGYTINSGNK